MAIYHFSMQVITRSDGRSSVAASAYRSASRMVDARTGEAHDFTRKEGVYHSEVMLPAHAPAWMADRSKLWNSVEAIERRKDAQLSREFDAALPVELTKQQQIALARDFVQREFVQRGMVAQLDLHDLDSHNPHLHTMLSLRDIEGEGWGKKNRDWNSKELLEHWRKAWAETVNRHLERAGHTVRIDHRSLADQGVTDREPQTHLGPHAIAVERKTGAPSRRRQDWQEAMQARAQEAAAAKIEEAQIAAELAAAEMLVETLQLDLAELELDERIKLRSAPQPAVQPRPMPPQPVRLPRAPARASADIRRDLERALERFEEPAAIADRSDVVMRARKRADDAQRKAEDAELVAGKRRTLVEDGRQRLRSTRKQLSDWKREHPFMRWWHEHVRPVKAAQALERTIASLEAKLPKAQRAADQATEALRRAQLASLKAQGDLLEVRQRLIDQLEQAAKPDRQRIKQLEKLLAEALEREREKPKQEPMPAKPEPPQAARWVDCERSELTRSYPRPRG